MRRNIVLLHGWGANVQKLQPLTDALKKYKWNVLVLEIPGFDAPEPETVWGVGEYAEYVSLWAKKAFKNQPYFVLGHSFGGRIGIKMAVSENNACEGLILCATGGLSRGNPIKRGIFFILAKTGKALLILPGVAHFWQTTLYKLAHEHDYEKASPRMKNIFKKVLAENLKSKVKRIKLPLLVLWGGKDKMTPVKDAYYIKSTLPNSKVVVFENEGHKLPYEKPKEVALAIEKWAKNLQQSS